MTGGKTLNGDRSKEKDLPHALQKLILWVYIKNKASTEL